MLGSLFISKTGFDQGRLVKHTPQQLNSCMPDLTLDKSTILSTFSSYY
ncbi:hypothetical protein SAMN05421761_105155 [Belliella pelovolcani]|uniref:Uncharacterized protein n=1 Tax=Belliella pelovolcani TaxID=529505 RepID=A0A1N7M745_9BACT|nr:hypothetical protein SAMN05421761_105155 [Belliella pelovolcani]